LFYDTAISILN